MPHGDALIGLVDATLGEDDDALIKARRVVVDAIGQGGLVDAAAVIGSFSMQNRVADATGLPLDAPIEIATRKMRTELGVERFGAAGQTKRGGWARALLSRALEPLAPAVVRIASGRKKGPKT